MNSRFDEAVEQILNDHVVMEAAPGMASAPGAQPVKKGTNVWSGLGRLAGSAIKGAAKVAGQAASVGMGLTPGAINTGVQAVKNTARGIGNVYQGREWGYQPPNPSATKSTSSPTSPTTPTSPATPTSPGSTPLNSLNIPRPALATLAKTFGGTTVQQAAVKTSLEAMFPPRGGASGYVSSVPTANVWNAVSVAADKTQPSAHYKDLITNSSLKSRFIANLQSELRTAGIDNRDAAKLVISVPAFFMTVPSSLSNDQVNTAIASLG